MKKTVWMLIISILLSLAGYTSAMGTNGVFETSHYVSFTGTVMDVIQGDVPIVILANANGELVSFVITEKAYWMDGAALIVGEQLEIFYILLPFTRAIYPPQHVAAVVAPMTGETHGSRTQLRQELIPQIDPTYTPSVVNTPDVIAPIKNNETPPMPSADYNDMSPVSLLYTFPDMLPPLD